MLKLAFKNAYDARFSPRVHKWDVQGLQGFAGLRIQNMGFAGLFSLQIYCRVEGFYVKNWSNLVQKRPFFRQKIKKFDSTVEKF